MRGENPSEDSNAQALILHKGASDGCHPNLENDNGELNSLSLDLSLLNQDNYLVSISFKKQKGMYSDLEYQEIFKQDFYNAQEEIIVFSSSIDEDIAKEFSLNVQKLIEFGVKVAVVTCNRAL